MRKFLPGFLLLLAATALRPAPAGAAECGLQTPAGGIAGIPISGETLAGNRAVVLLAAAGRSIERSLDAGEPGRADRSAGTERPAWRDPTDSGTPRSNARPAQRAEEQRGAAEHPFPEPGRWGILFAGFAGIISVARRRILSS
jgi:hypothetical protein